MGGCWRIRGLALVLVLALLAPGVPVVAAQPAADYQAMGHETIDCSSLELFGAPVLTGDVGEVECGVVQVPENWSRPGNRVLDITYAILRSTAEQPAPDPVVYLEGGPGGSALMGLESYAGTFAELRADRDVILFDQRGTQFSSPLECSMLTFDDLLGTTPATEVDPADLELVEEADVPALDLLPRTDTAALFEEARQQHSDGAAACVSYLLGEGIDLRQYNSIASGRDLMALLGALDIDQYNLYGISYGTRLALTVMRDHPDSGLRSVIIDSVFPPEIRGFESFPAEAHEVVIQVFADCAIDPVCNAAYPNLKARFIALLDHLKAEPIETPEGQTVAAIDLVTLMSTLSQAIAAVPYIPLMIAELEQGQTTTYNGIVSGALLGLDYDEMFAALDEMEELNAEGTPVAVDPFAPVLPDVGSDGEPLSLAELFINSVEVRARGLPEQDQDMVIFLLTSLDKLPHTEDTLREFVARTFSDDTQSRDRAALVGLINLMDTDDVREVFQIMAGSFSLLDIFTIGMNQAMFNSVECNEEMPFERFENTVATAAGLEIPEIAYGVPEGLAGQFATCEVWPSGRAPDFEALPVASDVPTLILAGSYDMQTPVSWNKLAFVNLANATFVEFPMTGHGVITYSPCASNVATQFIDQPWAAPDTSCVVELKPVWAMPGDVVPAATPVADPMATPEA